MKLKTIVSGLTLATAAAVIAAPSHAGVKYEGDKDAVAVCRAIMENDTGAMKSAIRRAAPQTGKLRVQSQKYNIECNGMSLPEFAAHVGATDALNELGGSVNQVAVR